MYCTVFQLLDIAVIILTSSGLGFCLFTHDGHVKNQNIVHSGVARKKKTQEKQHCFGVELGKTDL